MATDEKLDKILDVLLTLVTEIRDIKQEIRDLRSDQRKILDVLTDHSARLDRLETRQPAAH